MSLLLISEPQSPHACKALKSSCFLFPGNVRSRRVDLTFSVVSFPFFSMVASGALWLWEFISLLPPSGFASLTLGIPLPDYTNYTIKVGPKAIVQSILLGLSLAWPTTLGAGASPHRKVKDVQCFCNHWWALIVVMETQSWRGSLSTPSGTFVDCAFLTWYDTGNLIILLVLGSC